MREKAALKDVQRMNNWELDRQRKLEQKRMQKEAESDDQDCRF